MLIKESAQNTALNLNNNRRVILNVNEGEDYEENYEDGSYNNIDEDVERNYDTELSEEIKDYTDDVGENDLFFCPSQCRCVCPSTIFVDNATGFSTRHPDVTKPTEVFVKMSNIIH